jgi:radical SAM protein with 4Fe4S-binding SPASM domain
MIRQVVLEVTSACNLDCIYCYNVWKSPRCDYPRGQLPLQDTIRMIDRLLDELSLGSIAISGGEPFLRPDLPQIIAYLWSRHVQTVIITNGTLLTRERVEQTAGAYNYELPLLSYRREVHDRLTRREAFDRVIDGALNLRRLGGRFAVAFIATRLNYQDLDKTLELAVALGAEGMLYNRMNVSARNYPYAQELLPSLEMLRENLDVLENFASRYPFPISCSIPVQPCLIDTSQYEHIQFGFCPLGGENSYFTVDPLGNLRVCNHSSVILGNMLEDSFWDLYQRPYVDEFKTQMPASCLDCPAEIRDRCHGGCKAAAEECFGSFAVEEPFLACNLQRQTMPSPVTSPSG